MTQVLHAAYLDHAKAHGDRHPKVDVRMVEELKKLWAGCGVKFTRPREPALHRARRDGDRTTEPVRARHSGEPPPRLPDGDEHRPRRPRVAQGGGCAVRVGWHVRRAFGQGGSGWAGRPDRRESRGNAGLVRVDRLDRVFSAKSPEFLDRTETPPIRLQTITLNLSFYPDHPDHLDQDKRYKGLAGQGARCCPDQSPLSP